MTVNWTEIILAVIAFLSGWIVTRKKNKLDLSTEFVAKFRALIAEPLEEEVNRLRNEVNQLKDAIEGINDCDYSGSCPVRARMRKHKKV